MKYKVCILEPTNPMEEVFTIEAYTFTKNGDSFIFQNAKGQMLASVPSFSIIYAEGVKS